MDPVQGQVDAFNRRDLEGFISHYAADAVIEDGDGNVMMRGHDAMRQLYGALFANSPDLHAEIPNRMRVGDYVVDEERATGAQMQGFPSEMHGVVVYRIQDGKIAHVRLLM